MSLDSPRSFNVVAESLSASERKALIASIWGGAGQLRDGGIGQMMTIIPDVAAGEGELLFYVGFPGSARDKIPTQHYIVGARDEGAAIGRAHELCKQQPRTRKGSSLRVMLGRPPSTGPAG